MNLINIITNTIFPYQTNQNLLDIQSLFSQGTWINLPNYKASWVDFGDVVSSEQENLVINFGSVIVSKVRNDYTLESADLQYNEELTFEISPNNVENNVKTMRSAYCIFEAPYFGVTPATKIFSGLTSGSTGIIFTPTLSESQSFVFNFTGNTSVFTGFTANFNYNIYKYNSSRYNFLKPPVVSNSVDYQVFYNSLTFTATIDFTNFSDGEYLIRGGYSYPACTPSAKLLGLEYNTLNYIDPKIGHVKYRPSQDWYFAYITSAQTPVSKSLVSTNQGGSPFSVETLGIQTTGTTYYPTYAASGDYLVHINGVALEKGVEYISNTSSFILLVSVTSNDILTVAYVSDNGTNTSALVQSESYIVPSTIPNVTTPSIGEKLIYNINTNYYEYWLDVPPSGNIIFLRNGIQQSTGEYLVSSSDRRRVILFFTPNTNDIIQAFYASTIAGVQNISGTQAGILFSIPIAPQKENGNFEITFYNKIDTTLTTPLFSATTNYVIGQSVYNVNVPIPPLYNAGQEFIWRITNTKNYQLEVIGDIITTKAYSQLYNALLSTNELYNY